MSAVSEREQPEAIEGVGCVVEEEDRGSSTDFAAAAP